MARVLITGGSSGIGFELARSFGNHGHDIIITGVNEERLAGAKTRLEKELERTVGVFAQDLGKPDGAKALYQQIKQAGYEIDIMVNNAGMGLTAPTEEIDFESDDTLMQLNMTALVQLCKLYLPEMYNRGSGKILNVASVAAFQPGPYNATYFASKAFVLSYTRAIRYEAQSRGVQVCVLCPGSTKTPFFEKEGLETPVIADDPEKVAAFAYKMFNRNKAVIVPGLMNQVSRIIPISLRIRLVAMMKDLRKG